MASIKKMLCVNHLCIRNNASISGINPASPIRKLFFGGESSSCN